MKTILIADPDALSREPVAAALERNGYATVSASTSREAIGFLTSTKPDLILLDTTIPEMDGIVLLRSIRRNPAFRSTPVIILTEDAREDRVRQAAELGVHAYLLKTNFSLDDLLTRVQSSLAQ